MCLVAFFFLALLFAFMKLPFLTMTRPLLTFSLLNEENTPLVHTAKFKTWALLLPSRLCSLVNKTPCFIALSWIFTELFANGFPPVSVVYHFFFFSLFDLWLNGPLSPEPPHIPQPFHLCHIMTREDFTWSLFYFIGFLNPFPNIY